MIIDFTASKMEDELVTRHFMYQVLDDPLFAAQVLSVAKKSLSKDLYCKVQDTISQLRDNFANAEELRRAWRNNPDLFQTIPLQTPH